MHSETAADDNMLVVNRPDLVAETPADLETGGLQHSLWPTCRSVGREIHGWARLIA